MSERFAPDRRQFVLSCCSALIAGHTGLRAANPPAAAKPMTGPRILSLDLLSAAPLAQMKDFYQGLLGLRVAEERPDRLTIAAGESTLRFTPGGPEDGKPFYHFAFNIPENKIVDALRWQKERTSLIPIPERLRDPRYPPEVVDYSHWNAHSIFFLDPGGNVVEYIARHDLKNPAAGSFGSADILCASEIGLIVDDVAATAAALKGAVGVDPYRGASDQFTALGDEHGLLLVMKRGRILDFNPASDAKAARVYRTSVRVRGAEPKVYRFPGLPYEIAVNA